MSERYQVWYLGETWAVFDSASCSLEPMRGRDYASARSARRAAKRLNAALPDDWQDRDLVATYAEYTRLCREAHERGRPVPEWLRPRETPP